MVKYPGLNKVEQRESRWASPTPAAATGHAGFKRPAELPDADALAALRERLEVSDATVTPDASAVETADHDGVRVRFRTAA
jgi:hypothetical protein